MRIRTLACCSIVAALALGLAAPAAAAPFTVSKTADTNDGTCNADCSLREAIVASNNAPGPDTITVPAGRYVLTISGTDDVAAVGDLDIRDNVTIHGAGAGFGPGATIIDGGDGTDGGSLFQDRIFDVRRNATD